MAAESGQSRSAATETGRTSAAKCVPQRRANAQKRSLAITTPSARAIPPRRGSSAACSALRRTETTPARFIQDRIARRRPPGKCRAAYLQRTSVLPAAAAEEAEQQKHKHDDQDDPENRHAPTSLSFA